MVRPSRGLNFNNTCLKRSFLLHQNLPGHVGLTCKINMKDYEPTAWQRAGPLGPSDGAARVLKPAIFVFVRLR